jgi:hypothetical protein
MNTEQNVFSDELPDCRLDLHLRYSVQLRSVQLG